MWIWILCWICSLKIFPPLSVYSILSIIPFVDCGFSIKAKHFWLTLESPNFPFSFKGLKHFYILHLSSWTILSFCVKCENWIEVHLFSLLMSNHSTTVCWKDYLSPIELLLHLCQKSLQHVCVSSLFYSIDLYMYPSTRTTQFIIAL